MMMKKLPPFLLLLCPLLAGHSVLAQTPSVDGKPGGSIALSTEVQGADKALAAYQAARQKAEENRPAAAGEEDAGWKADLAAFSKSSATLGAEAAAQGWLDLYDALAAMEPEERQALGAPDEYSYQERDQPVNMLMKALPPPAAWPALATFLEARDTAAEASIADKALGVLAARLRGDQAAAAQAVAKLRPGGIQTFSLNALGQNEPLVVTPSVISAPSMVDQLLSDSVATLEIHVSGGDGGGEKLIANFEKQLAQLSDGSSGHSGIYVPALAQLTTPERAKELLLKALLAASERSELQRISDKPTHALAVEVALANIDQLKIAPWSLVDSPDQAKLYEALAAKFPGGSERDHRRNNAQMYYFIALLEADRTEDAMALLTSDELADHLLSAGSMRTQAARIRAYELALEYQAKAKTPVLYDNLVNLGAFAGKSAELVTYLKEASTKGELEDSARAVIHEALYRALLAGGQVEEAVGILRERISKAGGGGGGTGELSHEDLSMLPDEMRYQYYSQMQSRGGSSGSAGALALELAELGRLHNNTEWIEEGLKTYREKPSTDYQSTYQDLLRLLGRTAEEEASHIAEVTAMAVMDARYGTSDEYTSLESPEAFTDLALFYVRNGRPEDGLKVILACDTFMAGDIVDVLKGQRYDVSGAELAQVAAAGLLAQGDAAKARTVLVATLQKAPSNDDLYALLLKTGEAGLLDTLDALFALDAFQERPLIWKAQVLLDQGKLPEAEATVRQAIAIDPSDGEMGKGDRMRAYAVLAEILAKKGDEKDSKFFKAVVRAIRLSEDADDFWEAGMLTKAIAMYEEGLTQFSDAYCMQSRLALRAASMGQMDLAREHYTRAYELMPDSFGRVESHCFGCEGMFSTPESKSIAEEVFAELVKKTPEKPQVHYLLGYLYAAQDRDQDALKAFQEAVRLDPDYLNAWKHIVGLARKLALPAAERDAAAFALIRLDPLRRHTNWSTEGVSDWKQLWTEVEAAQAKEPKLPETLFPLPASQARLEKLLAGDAGGGTRVHEYVLAQLKETLKPGESLTPAQLVGGTGVAKSLASIIELDWRF